MPCRLSSLASLRQSEVCWEARTHAALVTRLLHSLGSTSSGHDTAVVSILPPYVCYQISTANHRSGAVHTNPTMQLLYASLLFGQNLWCVQVQVLYCQDCTPDQHSQNIQPNDDYLAAAAWQRLQPALWPDAPLASPNVSQGWHTGEKQQDCAPALLLPAMWPAQTLILMLSLGCSVAQAAATARQQTQVRHT